MIVCNTTTLPLDFQGVQCFNMDRPPYYRCGPCPQGLTGNGTYCSDVDECDLADPCAEQVTCYNTIPGMPFELLIHNYKVTEIL